MWLKITRDRAETNAELYPLMNFMMGHCDEFDNWEYVKRLKCIPQKRVTLYRGLSTDSLYKNKIIFDIPRCTSWSRDRKVAEKFSNLNGVIFWCTFDPDYMVFDTRFLADDLFEHYQWQKEIIIKPLSQIDIDRLNISVDFGAVNVKEINSNV